MLPSLENRFHESKVIGTTVAFETCQMTESDIVNIGKPVAHLVLTDLQEMVESRILPVISTFTLLRRAVFDDGFLDFPVPAPRECPALIYRMKRIDKGARTFELNACSKASRAEAVEQVHL